MLCLWVVSLAVSSAPSSEKWAMGGKRDEHLSQARDGMIHKLLKDTGTDAVTSASGADSTVAPPGLFKCPSARKSFKTCVAQQEDQHTFHRWSCDSLVTGVQKLLAKRASGGDGKGMRKGLPILAQGPGKEDGVGARAYSLINVMVRSHDSHNTRTPRIHHSHTTLTLYTCTYSYTTLATLLGTGRSTRVPIRLFSTHIPRHSSLRPKRCGGIVCRAHSHCFSSLHLHPYPHVSTIRRR
jgi:hypothetical protein